MRPDQVDAALVSSLIGRRLLDHPFYRRWEAGALRDGELTAYAEQYRLIEDALPGVLVAIADALPEGTAKDLVNANLADELAVPMAHRDLFASFAAAVDAVKEVPATPATARLIAVQQLSASTNPVLGLAAIAAYEVQAGDIATTKAAGLREHYGIDDQGCRFWDVHSEMEAGHAAWSTDALALLTDDAVAIESAAAQAADAWWGFLDEREALALV